MEVAGTWREEQKKQRRRDDIIFGTYAIIFLISIIAIAVSLVKIAFWG